MAVLNPISAPYDSKPIRECAESYLKYNRGAIEAMQMQGKLPRDEIGVANVIFAFCLDKEAENITEKNQSDFAKHFKNWVYHPKFNLTEILNSIKKITIKN